jgi:hypothetical protein
MSFGFSLFKVRRSVQDEGVGLGADADDGAEIKGARVSEENIVCKRWRAGIVSVDGSGAVILEGFGRL